MKIKYLLLLIFLFTNSLVASAQAKSLAQDTTDRGYIVKVGDQAPLIFA